jgi:hypothetical protein
MPNRDTEGARTPVGSPTDHARRAVSIVKAHRLPADTQSFRSISRSQTPSNRVEPETPLPTDMPPPQLVTRRRSIVTQSVHSFSRSQTPLNRVAPDRPLSTEELPPRLVPRKRSIHRKDDNHHSSLISTPALHPHLGEGLAGDNSDRSRLSIRSSAKRHKWIDDIVAVCLSSPDESCG